MRPSREPSHGLRELLAEEWGRHPADESTVHRSAPVRLAVVEEVLPATAELGREPRRAVFVDAPHDVATSAERLATAAIERGVGYRESDALADLPSGIAERSAEAIAAWKAARPAEPNLRVRVRYIEDELQEVVARSGLRAWVATRTRVVVADRSRVGRPRWATAGIGACAAVGLGALLIALLPPILVQGWRPVDELTALVLVAGGLLLCAGAVIDTMRTWRP